MVANDALADRESQAGSFVVSLGGEERIEDPIGNVIWNADSEILD